MSSSLKMAIVLIRWKVNNSDNNDNYATADDGGGGGVS